MLPEIHVRYWVLDLLRKIYVQMLAQVKDDKVLRDLASLYNGTALQCVPQQRLSFSYAVRN